MGFEVSNHPATHFAITHTIGGNSVTRVTNTQ
jgi:hypothetical protein